MRACPLLEIGFLLALVMSFSSAFAAEWPVEAARSHVLIQLRNTAFEPSGMAVLGNWLYVVSDDGRIGRQSLVDPKASLQIQKLDRDWFGKDKKLRDAENDFEALTVVPDDPHLYLGIEGDGKDLPHPKILRYLPPADTVDLAHYPVEAALGTRSQHVAWELNDPQKKGRKEEVRDGMEAMTFLPDGVHPFVVMSEDRAFAGVFLVASQKQKGLAFAYDLKKDGTVEVVGELTAPLQRAPLSDLLYAPNPATVYALSDEGGPILQELTVSLDGFRTRREWTVQFRTPGTMAGVEAVAIAPSGDLFLALDQSDEQAVVNGHCLGQVEQNKKGESVCDRQGWLNYVYRYEKFRTPETRTTTP